MEPPAPPFLAFRAFRKGSLGIALILLCGAVAKGELVHRWSFNQAAGVAPDGTALIDSVSSAAATVQGNFSEFDGSRLILQGSGGGNNTTTGTRSAAFISGYVDLPNGIISSKSNLSVEIWATPLSVRNFMRVFDFGRITGTGFGGGAAGEVLDVVGTPPPETTVTDNLMLSFCRGEHLDQQRFEALVNGGGKVTVDTGAATDEGVQYHYVVTFEDGVGSFGSGGGRMTWYRNGVQQGSGDVAFHLSDLEDVNNWLGRSQWTADRNTHAAYNELRIYDHALAVQEITANFAAGPDVIVNPPEPEPAPAPDHLWVFNDAADSTASSGLVFQDSIGGMPVTLRGNGASLTGTSLKLPGTTNGNLPESAISAYLDLPNGIISAQPSITLEAWATPLSSKAYQRLFDFGRTNVTSGSGAAPGEIIDGSGAPGAFGGYDNFVLSLNVANNLGTHRLEGQIHNGEAIFTDSAAATVAGTQYHYVLVLEDGAGMHGANGCQIRWYRNGALQNTLDLAFRLSQMQDVNNWIGRSQYSGDSCSNFALNELRIYRHSITPGEVLASYQAGPDPNSGPPEPQAPAPVPVHRWSFTGASAPVAAGTVFTDSATGEAITLWGNGASLANGSLVLPGTTNGNQSAANISAYLDLPNGIVSTKPSISFEAWLTPLSSKNWQRIFEIGSTSMTSGGGAVAGEIIDSPVAPGAFVSADNLFLSLNNAGVLGSHRLEARLNGGSTLVQNSDLSASTPVGTEHHYVLTVQDRAGASGSSGCQAKWYRDGELQGSLDLSYRLADLKDVNNWIGRSMWAADMNSNFALNELRIHSRALSAAEVSSSHTAGADVVFPPPATQPDTATIHPGQKVRIAVLANDSGAINPATLEIVTPPASGTASVDPAGGILYVHGGVSSSDSFSYRVSGDGGTSALAQVSVSVSGSMRIPSAGLNVPASPPATAIQVVPAYPGASFTKALCFASPPGDTKRLFVCELGGKLKVIPDVTATSPTSSEVLDMLSVITSPPRVPAETITPGPNGECGLLGLAFHPDYAENGYFYVTYSVVKAGSSGWFQRLSRFTMPPDQIGQAAPVADPASELILIEQADREDNHNGGDLHFGADGYLYYAVGDEANPFDLYLNSQRIDKNIFSAMLRIDVDKKLGNLEPNPHVSIPTQGGLARFSVPADNPFVGATSFNGLPVNPAEVRTEFWAVGLRSPWRFSIDRPTGEIWLGDVGQGTYEEVDLIEKGGNYGWIYREGRHDIAWATPAPPPKPAGFTSIDPIYEYVHTAFAGDSSYKGNSVIGGVVYRGTRMPALTGSYIFGDQVSGHIWSLRRAGDVPGGAVTVQRIAGQPYLSNFGVDPSNGDVLVSDYYGGRIMRIVSATVDNSFPGRLSETGLFADLADLSPSPGVLPYEPNLTFWSDHAVKRRWFAIPDETKRMTWSRDGHWAFPEGQIWVKHFDLETERGNPSSPKKRIETRLLVKNSTGMYGVSYRWNEAGTEAVLAPDGGEDFPVNLTVDGQPYFQQWRIPSRAQCLACHSPQAGHALSFNTRQLNLSREINGFSGNQIDLLQQAGYFANTPDSVNLLPRHLRADETEYPLEERVRSYLAVNCSYCHAGASGTAPSSWDGRHEISLAQTGLILGEANGNGGNPANKLVVPGDTLHSIVLNRVAVTNGFTRMPPLGSNEIDDAGVALLTAWINGPLDSRLSYEEWRENHFGNDPEGAPSADPDGDGVSNHDEFLAGSSPQDGASLLRPFITRNGTAVGVGFSIPANRSVRIESSRDLSDWSLWDVPRNDGVSLPAGPQFFEGDSEDPARFFRLQIEER